MQWSHSGLQPIIFSAVSACFFADCSSLIVSSWVAAGLPYLHHVAESRIYVTERNMHRQIIMALNQF